MRRLTSVTVLVSFFASVWVLLLVNVSAHDTSNARSARSPFAKLSSTLPARLDLRRTGSSRMTAAAAQGQGAAVGKEGRRLFEVETFGGNGRTCLTCHSTATGTVSPADAQARFDFDPNDPLFVHDGSDDGLGTGVSRMLADATILMKIRLPSNARLLADPAADFVTLRRGIPTTLNTPALDPVLMVDGRQPNLPSQALGAIHDHAQSAVEPTPQELDLIAQFQLTDRFFSSTEAKNFAHGAAAPRLPPGRTASEKRGRRFFEDIPPDAATGKDGLCAACHAGPMLNQTSRFLTDVLPLVPEGTRFQSALVSEFNFAGNPLQIFRITRTNGSTFDFASPDPGRSLITGVWEETGAFDNVNAFKIMSLRGIARTAPYFHDSNAKTLEDVALHYREFFLAVSQGTFFLDDQDLADMVAYMKLLQ